MEPLASLTKRARASTGRLTKNSKLFKTILEAIREKKGENIVSLDLRKIDEAVSDFFVICEASSHPQLKAIADNVEDRVRELVGEKVFHKEGFQQQHWVLLDYINIVVHIMFPESRKFYNLEDLWQDAVAQEHQS